VSSWATALVAAAACLLAPAAARAAASANAASSSAATVATNGAVAPGAVTYGISDAQGQFATCPTSDDPCSSATGLSGFWKNGALTALAASPRPVSSVRFPVKYDAVSTWNGSSGCAMSNPYRYAYVDQGGGQHPAGQSWFDLLYGLQAAYADGLRPLIVIVGYTAADAVKSYSATSARGDPGEPDPTTSAGYMDYYCGVRGILNGIAAHLPSYQWPHQWEAWNEPNGGCAYLNNDCSAGICARLNEPAGNQDSEHHNLTCSATGEGQSGCAAGADEGGAAKAACLWIIADDAIANASGHAGDTVAAGTLSWPSTGYLAPYVALLASQGRPAATYSVHDYGDPTASGWLGGSRSDQLQAFDTALGRDTAAAGAAAGQLWVTESGVDLTDRDRRYGQFDSVPCAGGSGSTLPNTLGACVDGNKDAQIRSAQGFFDLRSVTGGPPVTALYWYQFVGSPGGWDSGLLDATGHGRAAYCVWTEQPTADCAGDAQSYP
jgi:hypothetical protein